MKQNSKLSMVFIATCVGLELILINKDFNFCVCIAKYEISSTQNIFGTSCSFKVITRMSIKGYDFFAPLELRDHVTLQIYVIF